MIGDEVEATSGRAATLRACGIIGNRVEVAVKKLGETPEKKISEKSVEPKRENRVK